MNGRLEVANSGSLEVVSTSVERSSNPLVMQFAVELVELADKYDSLDHDAEIGGSELQGLCHITRQLARAMVKSEVRIS